MNTETTPLEVLEDGTTPLEVDKINFSAPSPTSVTTFTLRTSPFMPAVVSQGDFLQSCVPCAVTNAIKYYDNKNNIVRPYRSRLFLYWYARKQTGNQTQNVGVTMPDISSSIANYGISSEILWPYPTTTAGQQAVYKVEPSRTAYTDAKANQFVKFKVLTTNLNVIKNTLSVKKYPVIAVVRLFNFKVTGTKSVVNSLEYAQPTGNIPYPSTCRLANGKTDPSYKACSLQLGHCILIVGWDDVSRVFLIQNCYGTSWGDGGYGTIPYSYISNANLASNLYAMY